ncbi:MAG TPA: hypothetical protein VFI25_08585 [Planctomycetota bacterium]|jgi:hypothetical protein|nr:hypothetical protein [Planctomycetota bacterium]
MRVVPSDSFAPLASNHAPFVDPEPGAPSPVRSNPTCMSYGSRLETREVAAPTQSIADASRRRAFSSRTEGDPPAFEARA